MNIVGKIHEVGVVQNVTDTFKKRDLIVIVAENPEYPEYIRVEFTQDKVDLLDKFKVGQDVDVSFNLRGRPFTNKQGVTTYFNSIVGWRIVEANGSNTVERVDINQDEDDSLPF